MDRRKLLGSLLSVAAVAASATPSSAQLFWFDDEDPDDQARRRRRRKAKKARTSKTNINKRPAYKGRQVVSYFTFEKPGTIIIKTRERALYQILDDGRAMRYLVAVGREGFGWSGTARVGLKRVNPTWTPPAEMIERSPEYEEWADGMPGGIPENPLGARALYLYQGRQDTLFRIHGTNAPSSIGTAASSGCIRMLNKEVIELYANTPIGTKVIVR
jgi:lipoprotein-anchoring transpeptidase ErfK/SrfK